MLRQVGRALTGKGSRAGAVTAIGVLAFALGACSLLPHRMRPGSETGAEVKAPPGSDQPYPALASVPDRPKQNESADSRREIARSLLADQESARYTDQALRGGTEASAPPPPPPVAALPALPADNTGALGPALKTADKSEAKKPSFFGRLFGAKKDEQPVPASTEPAPLPAQPTGAVEMQQAPATH
jgi:hypothetical protein